jgi:resuscitation-promoting factor RpfA
MDREELDRLVARNDAAALVRLVDQLGSGGDWAGLVAVAAACRAAASTGRQLWPVSSLAEYRLALRAPGPWAAGVLRDDDAGRFALGPLSEVAASTHEWAELEPWLELGPMAAYVGQERVLRGEDLRGVSLGTDALELPLVLQRWEPEYALAVYEDEEAHFDPPPIPPVRAVGLPGAPSPVADEADEATRALAELAGHWAQQSDGRIQVATVNGDHRAAIAGLGVPEARVAEIAPADAMAWMAWVAASGGAHARRPGGAAGRFGAWWTAAALGGLDWPPDADELGDVIDELRWYWWDAHEPVTAWQVRLAVWDPAEGLAWALSATDAR